jgi:hypothetical protein
VEVVVVLEVALGVVEVADVAVVAEPLAAGEAAADLSALEGAVVEHLAAPVGVEEVSVAVGEEAEEDSELFCTRSCHRSRLFCMYSEYA